MNILMITPDYPPNLHGGIGTHTFTLANELIKKGCNVTVIVGRLDKNQDYHIEKHANLTVVSFQMSHRKPLNEGYDDFGVIWSEANTQLLPQVLRYLERYLEKNPKFDIIHVHDYFCSLVAVAVKQLYKIPMVVTIHGARSAIGDIKDIKNSLRRFILNNADIAIAVSEWVKETITEDYVHVPHDFRVINLSINLSNEKKPPRNLIANETIITYCGRLHRLKGCDDLINAFSTLIQKQPTWNLRLQLIGDGPFRPQLESQVRSLEISDKVEFLGFYYPNRVREMLGGSSLHIVPSKHEPGGIIALEAMAEGVPVIISEIGGMKELAKDRWNCRTVSPNNPVQLADIMEEMLIDYQLSESYVHNALEFVQEFSPECMANETKKVYTDLLLRTTENVVN